MRASSVFINVMQISLFFLKKKPKHQDLGVGNYAEPYVNANAQTIKETWNIKESKLKINLKLS